MSRMDANPVTLLERFRQRKGGENATSVTLLERFRERRRDAFGANLSVPAGVDPESIRAGEVPSESMFADDPSYQAMRRLGIEADPNAPFGIKGAAPAVRGIPPAGVDDTPDRSLAGE